ncbi:MAG: FAD-dependent oxidoreductase [Gaiellales bacterium]
MRRDVDVLVVGAGITGSATARLLAQAGRDVLLVDRFPEGHSRGGSHGASRIFRLNYADERYVRLAQASLEGWRELEAECGERLILPTGVLDVGPETPAIARALSSCGVHADEVTPAEARDRWGIAIADGEPALYQPDGGISLADRALVAFQAGAREAGAVVLYEAEVRSLTPERAFVRAEIGTRTVIARAVVVAAGAWAPELLGTAGIDLPVIPTRETVVYLDLPGVEELPPLIDYARVPAPGTTPLARAGVAGFALASPGDGLKAGLHHAGPVTDPSDDPEPEETIAAWAAEWARSRYLAAGDVLGTDTCLYTNTADESFVLERRGRIVVGSACSGHGFKFAPQLGRTLAALAREAAGF